MRKKIYTTLGIMCVVYILAGCVSTTEKNSNVPSTIDSTENISQTAISKEETQESEISVSDLDNNLDTDIVGRLSDNPNIRKIEEDPHFEGASQLIDDFLNDLVNDRFEDAKNKCSPSALEYSYIGDIASSADISLMSFAESITSISILIVDIKKPIVDIKNIKKGTVLHSILNNKYLKELFYNINIKDKFDEPIITDITENSKRSLTYEIEIDELFFNESKTMNDILYNSDTFESIIAADFFKNYYDKNSKDIDKLYDKYNSEIEGKNVILAKFFDDNGKEFCDKVSEELEDGCAYLRIIMYINLQKEIENGKSKWIINEVNFEHDNIEDDYPDFFKSEEN